MARPLPLASRADASEPQPVRPSDVGQARSPGVGREPGGYVVGVAVAPEFVREDEVEVEPIAAQDRTSLVLTDTVLGQERHEGDGKWDDAAGPA